VLEDTLAELLSVDPEFAVAFTVNTIVTELPFFRSLSAQLTMPVPPIAGCEHVPTVVVAL
jgi:hypothetical protein